MPREQPEIKETKPADVVNVMFTLANIDTACVTPFLRSGLGQNSFAPYPLAALWMFFYAGAARCPLLVWYLVPWMLMIAVRRCTADPTQHSRFQGRAWVFGWMANEYVARLGEVFIVFFGAVFAAMVSIPLAKFVMLKCITLLIVFATEQSVIHARRIAKRDSAIEARYYSEL